MGKYKEIQIEVSDEVYSALEQLEQKRYAGMPGKHPCKRTG